MIRKLLVTLLLTVAVSAAYADPQTTAFTYQGSLSANGSPANGVYNLTFNLYNAATGGTPLTAPVQINNLTITNGAFSVDVDFPGQFTGQQCWIEVTVNGGTPLLPRQPVNSVPVAQYAVSPTALFLSSSGGGWDSSTSTPINPANLTTGSTQGTTAKAVVLPLSGHDSIPVIMDYLGGNQVAAGEGNPVNSGSAQRLPVAANFTKMSGTLTVESNLILLDTTIYVTAQLFRDQFGYGAQPVPGASCSFIQTGLSSPGFGYATGGIVPVAMWATCTNNAISASFNAGDTGFWVVSATATPAPGQTYSAHTFPVDVTMSLSQ
jgi:hypothetical protein